MADTPSTVYYPPRASQRQSSTIKDGWCNSSATSFPEIRSALIRSYDPDTKCVACDQPLEPTEFERTSNETPGTTATTFDAQDPTERASELLLGYYGLRCGVEAANAPKEHYGCGRPVCFQCADLVACVDGHTVYPSRKEVREKRAAESLKFCFGNDGGKHPMLKPGRTFWHPTLTEQDGERGHVETKGITCSRVRCPNPRRLVRKPAPAEGKDYGELKAEYMAKLYECPLCFAVFCQPCGDFLSRLVGPGKKGCKLTQVQHFQGAYRKKARERKSPQPVEGSQIFAALETVRVHDSKGRRRSRQE